ncbi:chemotaxis protein CheB [Hymenobacter sp. GOD-10R]|uniref:chemotaxis protein CheB n=1 Tax=Hymenobacter sp. GOD-10R TaxID=3093922 RepID=UPI002D7703B5|nr:chemotaxis protein CheB [Hymenobacter sp. GOD-10R]WRQ26523.1 chemotaxis protein CheB [Hymenobacter sp. GOD-10R]
MQTLTPFTILLGNLPIQVRLTLTRLVQKQPDLRVVNAGSDSEELGMQARRLRPDVVIVADSHISALEALARQYPVPVLLYASTPLLQGILQQTSRWGVRNSIGPLPLGENAAVERWQEDVLHKVRALQPPLLPASKRTLPAHTRTLALPRGIVVIGASTGGVRAVEELVKGLKIGLSWALVVAVHLPAHFTPAFVARLRRSTLLPVEIAETESILEAGKITVVPGECNMVVQAGHAGAWPIWKLVATPEPSPSFDEPSIDLLMCSAVQVAGLRVLGAILTGLGHDGTLGAQAIRKRGGVVIVQDKASSEVFSMPNSVIRAGWANEILPLRDLAACINNTTITKADSSQRLPIVSAAQTVCR